MRSSSSNGSLEDKIKTSLDDKPEDVLSLMSDIKSCVQKLRELGCSESEIATLFERDASAGLSRILITKDFKIILPDYNGYEVKLTPLAKALYLLYLSHPEGLEYKQLRDHYPELKSFYLSVSKRENLQKARKSLLDLCNSSSSNSVNEKCSAIRNALKGLPEDVRNYYCISGSKGCSRKIMLPADLIQWEEK